MALDFPNAPTIGQVFPSPSVAGVPVWRWDGAEWVPVTSLAPAIPDAVSDNMTYGRRNGVWAPILKKNYILNGAMMVSQENGATVGTTVGFYIVDPFWLNIGTSGAASSAQVASLTPAGSPNRIRVTITTAEPALAANHLLCVDHRIEGLRTADLKLGTAVAKQFTLQFGVKAPAGTYSVVFENGGTNRTYVAEYIIAAGEANTDVIKSVTVAGDVTGTWAVDNTTGLIVRFGLAAGTTYQKAAGSWGPTDVVGSLNQFNLLGTVGNVWELFDVGLYEGTVAPAFMVPDFVSELALCKRYFRLVTPEGAGIAASPTDVYFTVRHEGMRIAPAASVVAVQTITNITVSNFTQSAPTMSTFANSPDGGQYVFTSFSGISGGSVLLFRSYNGLKLSARL
jgi:hypothetical protein